MRMRLLMLSLGFIAAGFSACDCGQDTPTGKDASLPGADAGHGDAAVGDGSIDQDAAQNTDAQNLDAQSTDTMTDQDAEIGPDVVMDDAAEPDSAPANTAPEIDSSALALFPGEQLNLGNAITDAEDDISDLSCEWDFASLPTGVMVQNGESCEPIFTVSRALYACGASSVSISLTVTDSGGLSTMAGIAVQILDERGPYVDNTSSYAGIGDSSPYQCCGAPERPCNTIDDAMTNSRAAINDGAAWSQWGDGRKVLKIATTDQNYALDQTLVLDRYPGLECGFDNSDWSKDSNSFVPTPIRFSSDIGVQVSAENIIISGCDIQGGSMLDILHSEKVAVDIVGATDSIIEDNILVGQRSDANDGSSMSIGLRHSSTNLSSTLTLIHNDITGGLAEDQAIGAVITGSCTSTGNIFNAGLAKNTIGLLLDGDYDDDGTVVPFVFRSQSDSANGDEAQHRPMTIGDGQAVAVRAQNEANLNANDLQTSTQLESDQTQTAYGIMLKDTSALTLNGSTIETGFAHASSIGLLIGPNSADVFISGCQFHAGRSDNSVGNSTAVKHDTARLEMYNSELSSAQAASSFGLWNSRDKFQPTGAGDSVLKDLTIRAGEADAPTTSKSLGLYHLSGLLNLSDSNVSATASHSQSIALEMDCALSSAQATGSDAHALNNNIFSSSQATTTRALFAHISGIHVGHTGCGLINSQGNSYLSGPTDGDNGSLAMQVIDGHFDSRDDEAISAGSALSASNTQSHMFSRGASFANCEELTLDNLTAQAGPVTLAKQDSETESFGVAIYGVTAASISNSHLSGGDVQADQKAWSAGLFLADAANQINVTDSVFVAGDVAAYSNNSQEISAGLWLEAEAPLRSMRFERDQAVGGAGAYSYGAYINAETKYLRFGDCGRKDRLGRPIRNSGLVAGLATSRSAGLAILHSATGTYVHSSVITGGDITGDSILSPTSYGLYVYSDFQDSTVKQSFIFAGDHDENKGSSVGIYTPYGPSAWHAFTSINDDRSYFENNVIQAGDTAGSFGVLTNTCVGSDMRFLHNVIHAGGAHGNLSAAVRFGSSAFLGSYGLCENLPVFIGNILDAGGAQNQYGFYEHCGSSYGFSSHYAAAPSKAANTNFMPGSGIYVHDAFVSGSGFSTSCSFRDLTTIVDVNTSTGPYTADDAAADDRSWDLDPDFLGDGYHISSSSPLIDMAVQTQYYQHSGFMVTPYLSDIDGDARTDPYDIGCDEITD